MLKYSHTYTCNYIQYTYLYKCMSISSILHNRDYIQTHCNDYRKTFHFACRQWYSYNNPGILT